MANKVQSLVEKLIERTDQGKVGWEITEESIIYQATFPSYSVRIAERTFPTRDDNEFVLTVYDDQGQTIDVVTESSLESSGFRNAHERLEELHRAARRQARGVDRAIEELLAELG